MLEIREEGPESFAEHGKIPCFFWGRSRVDLPSLRQGEIKEIPCDPFMKDYDDFVDERPANLATKIDGTLIAAYQEGHRVGGAIMHGPNLIDIRVMPDLWGQGIGAELVKASLAWAQRQGFPEIKIETQDNNVAACMFYKALGAKVHEITEGAYLPDLDETRIIWVLRQGARNARNSTYG